MSAIFRIAAAFELALTGVEGAFHNIGFLPLGGGALQQIGLAFIAAFVLAEFSSSFKEARSTRRPRERRW